MESIYVLAMAKSHRTSNDKELIRWEQDYGKIEGVVQKRYGPVPIELTLSKKVKKEKIKPFRAVSPQRVCRTNECGHVCSRRFKCCKRESSN